MNFTAPNLLPALPEIFVLTMACVVLLCNLFINQNKNIITYGLAQITLVGALGLTVILYPTSPAITFHGSFISDQLSSLLKIFIYITSYFSFLYARQYMDDRDMPSGDFYILGLFSVLGMMVLVSSYSFISLYLGLELLSLPLYVMVAMRKNINQGSEAAMKYFVMGAIGSGLLLYGLSILYGLSGSLEIAAVGQVFSKSMTVNLPVYIFALVFIITGIAFKFGAVPFHMWVPDVYDGAPTSVALFIGSAPKVAAMGLAVRLLLEALPGLHVQWSNVLIVISLLSMGLGNIIAIAQTNIKRMLAYSSIAHMGYMLLGIIAATASGFASSVFYMLVYAIMSMGAFAMIIVLSKQGFDCENIDDFKGLNSRHPWLAFLMLLIMFSMAGIPPTVGFFAKMGVLEALIRVHLVWLAAVALIFALIGMYYYLRIIKVMYFEEPIEAHQKPKSIILSGDVMVALSVNGLVLLLLGIFPSILIQLCRHVFGG